MRLRLGIIGLLLCVASGCGYGSGSGTTGNMRFVQASPNAPLVTLYDNRKIVSANLGYSNATGYIGVHSGDKFRVLPTNGSTAILTTTVSVGTTTNQTLIMTGAVANPTSVVLTDGGATATTGDGNVRVVNASSGLQSPDIYIVPTGTNISGLSPTATGVGFDSNTGYQLVAIGTNTSGTYEVLFTSPGTKSALLDTGPLNLSSSSDQTVVALDNPSGGFTFTVLTDQ